MTALVVALALALVAAVGGVVFYNRLVGQRNAIADAWSGIDVQLTRRADLVPNLVAVVKGYQVHERETLEAVTAARAAAQAAKGPAESGEAERVLEGSVTSLLAVSEAYPDLKADESFLQLQTDLATLEEDISFARRYYNAVVRKFNTTQQTFPIVLVARPLGFREAEYFQADLDAKSVPNARL
ncbi:MAG TPA: LemA family protein [Acidimicrobiales bacterium]|nr:LemA family protein [Acidimicrobiales bacterium]